MPKKRFSSEQIIAKLRHNEVQTAQGKSIALACAGARSTVACSPAERKCHLVVRLRRKPFSNSVRSTPPGQLRRFRCSKAVISIVR